MMSFSQRKGFTPVSDVIQVGGMNDDLRISLWNVLDMALWSSNGFLRDRYSVGLMGSFSARLWFSYFKRPIDTRSDDDQLKLNEIRDFYFGCAWNEAYDFIEFVGRYFAKSKPDLTAMLNATLERELSGYRIIGGCIVDITSEQEVAMLDEAIRDTVFAGVSAHLQRALELLSDRHNPDYRNSIKESISAVESMARIVSSKPKATLGDALRILDNSGLLHTSLRAGFDKLYGYTSDEDGIRHAMLEKPNITAADARYFLLSCTSFTNYLKAQMPPKANGS